MKKSSAFLGFGILALLVALWKIITRKRVGPYFER
jgi:hypothetical protein